MKKSISILSHNHKLHHINQETRIEIDSLAEINFNHKEDNHLSKEYKKSELQKGPSEVQEPTTSNFNKNINILPISPEHSKVNKTGINKEFLIFKYNKILPKNLKSQIKIKWKETYNKNQFQENNHNNLNNLSKFNLFNAHKTVEENSDLKL